MCKGLEVRRNVQSQQATLRLARLLLCLVLTYQDRLPRSEAGTYQHRQTSEGSPRSFIFASWGVLWEASQGRCIGRLHSLPSFQGFCENNRR